MTTWWLQPYRPNVSSTSKSIAALPSSDVNMNYVSSHVHVRIYVGSGRRVGNFLNTAQSLHCHPRPGLGRGACVGSNTSWKTTPPRLKTVEYRFDMNRYRNEPWKCPFGWLTWALVCNRGIFAMTAREGDLIFVFKLLFVWIFRFVGGVWCYLWTE